MRSLASTISMRRRRSSGSTPKWTAYACASLLTRSALSLAGAFSSGFEGCRFVSSTKLPEESLKTSTTRARPSFASLSASFAHCAPVLQLNARRPTSGVKGDAPFPARNASASWRGGAGTVKRKSRPPSETSGGRGPSTQRSAPITCRSAASWRNKNPQSCSNSPLATETKAGARSASQFGAVA